MRRGTRFSRSRCQSFLKTAIISRSQIHSLWFCHTDETAIFHNKSRLLAMVEKTTRIRFFITVRKGVWENTSKKKPQMVGEEQNHIPEWTHMCKTLTCTTQANLYWRGNVQPEYVLRCTQLQGGGARTIPLVKQRLQNSQNVWNLKVSHIFHFPKQIKGSLCAHVWTSGVHCLLL